MLVVHRNAQIKKKKNIWNMRYIFDVIDWPCQIIVLPIQKVSR